MGQWLNVCGSSCIRIGVCIYLCGCLTTMCLFGLLKQTGSEVDRETDIDNDNRRLLHCK